MHVTKGASRCHVHAHESKFFTCIVLAAQLTCSKVTGLAKRMAHSDQLHKAFEECCEHESLKPLMLKCPVATQWNMHCECLRHQLEQWAVVSHLCNSTLYSCHDLEEYSLEACEWDILGQMQPILHVCISFVSVVFYILTSKHTDL